MPKRLSLTIVAVLLFAAGCTTTDGSDALTLGAIYPISGLQGPGGAEEANGVKLAVELANERGGVRGRPVRLELLDVDRGDAAPRALAQLQGKGVDVVLGTYGSTISAPAAAAAQRRGMVLWETGAVGLVGS
ncbi:MAG TPA: ABC transporter substrate-binding protein, partial [Acidimicrobiales bacterium]|nr:ABC transporter substrate-binding protein [Acidimicrobiales bacterium]